MSAHGDGDSSIVNKLRKIFSPVSENAMTRVPGARFAQPISKMRLNKHDPNFPAR
jgi:hypothetical protein